MSDSCIPLGDAWHVLGHRKGRPADADRPFRDAVVLGTQTS